jgi:hypothetical protein
VVVIGGYRCHPDPSNVTLPHIGHFS